MQSKRKSKEHANLGGALDVGRLNMIFSRETDIHSATNKKGKHFNLFLSQMLHTLTLSVAAYAAPLSADTTRSGSHRSLCNITSTMQEKKYTKTRITLNAPQQKTGHNQQTSKLEE
jgi:hypothetical protein